LNELIFLFSEHAHNCFFAGKWYRLSQDFLLDSPSQATSEILFVDQQKQKEALLGYT